MSTAYTNGVVYVGLDAYFDPVRHDPIDSTMYLRASEIDDQGTSDHYWFRLDDVPFTALYSIHTTRGIVYFVEHH